MLNILFTVEEEAEMDDDAVDDAFCYLGSAPQSVTDHFTPLIENLAQHNNNCAYMTQLTEESLGSRTAFYVSAVERSASWPEEEIGDQLESVLAAVGMEITTILSPLFDHLRNVTDFFEKSVGNAANVACRFLQKFARVRLRAAACDLVQTLGYTRDFVSDLLSRVITVLSERCRDPTTTEKVRLIYCRSLSLTLIGGEDTTPESENSFTDPDDLQYLRLIMTFTKKGSTSAFCVASVALYRFFIAPTTLS